MFKVAIERNRQGHHEIIVKDCVAGSNIECRHILPLVTSPEGEILLKQIGKAFDKSSERLNTLRKKVDTEA